MDMDIPSDFISSIVESVKKADINALMQLYDDDAVLIDYMNVNGGDELRGKHELEAFFSKTFKPGVYEIQNVKAHLVEADGIALLTWRWSLKINGVESKTFTSTVVLRRQSDGSWKNLIDNSPAVLDLVGIN